MLTDNLPVLLPLLFLVAGMLIPVVAWKRNKLAWPLTILVSLTSVVFSVMGLVRVLSDGPIRYYLGNWLPPIGIEYVLDHLSAFIVLVINGVAFLVLFHSKEVVKRDVPDGKEAAFYGTAVLMLCGFNGIVITGDLFNLYVFLEISSLSLYGLLAVGQKQAPVASFRYLIMGTVAGSFYLLGVGFIYITTGSLNMADVKAILPTVLNSPAAPTIFIALALMVLGMGIKMALFPMHGWLPDAYTYASDTTSALVAPSGTKVASYVLLRVMFFVFGVTYVSKTVPIANAVAWLAAIGIIYGSIMAIAQKELKRMLAYSSVAQVGYIGLGIGLANPLGIIGAILHVLNHAFMKACLFLVSANLRFKLGHSDISKLDNTVRKKMPWTMAAFTVSALSMVGLPPMAGFFSKWYLALGTIKSSNWLFLAVILASSLLNAVYFFRILEKVYMKPLKEHETDSHDHHHGDETDEAENIERTEVSSSMLIPTLVMAAGLIVLGLLNALIVNGIIKFIVPAGM
ncbi:MAG: monovalent cation/H+ antiporter subunit D family protein [bacterium]|nr:monovalent cation/H+ antiporter subunit D family protein [bacterium]